MALVFPGYITRVPGIGSPDVRFPWDDWNVHSTYQPPDPALLEKLAMTTRAAQTALAIASAEWLVYRLNVLEDDPNPPDFLEAAWAASIDRAYMEYVETDDTEWRGPLRGPMNLVMMMLLDALFVYDRSELVVPHPAWISKLLDLVLPDAAPYHAWRDGCLERLAAAYPAAAIAVDPLFTSARDHGDPVPREAFDLGRPFDRAEAPALFDRFLRTLDPEDNLLLHFGEDMIETGFLGTPYRYGPVS